MTSTPRSPGSDAAAESAVCIYHNPQCSRSREALQYLEQQGIQPKVVRYLETPLNVDELRKLVRMLGIAPSSLIRSSDFKRLGLQPTSDYEKLLELIAKHPSLMERPIVVAGDVARIGRPIENLYELFGAPGRNRT
jgi:arsenate reductase